MGDCQAMKYACTRINQGASSQGGGREPERAAHGTEARSPNGLGPGPKNDDLLCKDDEVANDGDVDSLDVAAKLLGTEDLVRRRREVEPAGLDLADAQVIDLLVPAPEEGVESIVGDPWVHSGRDGKGRFPARRWRRLRARRQLRRRRRALRRSRRKGRRPNWFRHSTSSSEAERRCSVTSARLRAPHIWKKRTGKVSSRGLRLPQREGGPLKPGDDGSFTRDEWPLLFGLSHRHRDGGPANGAGLRAPVLLARDKGDSDPPTFLPNGAST